MIEIVDVHKSFNSNKVLNGVIFNIEDGKTTVIIGSSGCGKTVLLKHIVGLLIPDAGKIIIDGVDITKITKKELFEIRKKISVVFQLSALLDSLTVAENITLALREHTKLSEKELMKIAKEKLSLVKMEGTENLLPSALSGGMKKRVAIARALATNPKYILYDEPTTALDPITANKIDELICELQEKFHMTAVIVTHDLTSAYKVGDKIAMLANGKIIFEGTPEEVKSCKKEEVLKFIYGREGL